MRHKHSQELAEINEQLDSLKKVFFYNNVFFEYAPVYRIYEGEK